MTLVSPECFAGLSAQEREAQMFLAISTASGYTGLDADCYPGLSPAEKRYYTYAAVFEVSVTAGLVDPACFLGLSREEQDQQMFAAVAGIEVEPDEPVPQENLLYDLRAGVGIAAADGAVFSWTPQGGSITDPTVQATAVNRPWDMVDNEGNACVAFGAQEGPHTLELPAAIVLNSRAFSVWVVCDTENNSDMPIVTATGIAAPLLRFQNGGIPSSIYGNDHQSAIYVPINKNVYGCVSGAAATVVHNAATSQSLAVATNETGSGGGVLGTTYFGRLYRVLIYGAEQSPADVAATKAALIATHDVVTTYANRLVAMGDSQTSGYGQTKSQNWPYRLGTMKRTWEIFTAGGFGATLTNMTTAIPGVVDALFDAAKNCELLLWGGTVDVNNNDSAAVTFGRIQTFCDDALAANAWDAMNVCTLADLTGKSAVITSLNALIRAGDPSYTNVVDFGRDSVLETRLSDSADATYFTDGIHQTDAGAQVVADFVRNDFGF